MGCAVALALVVGLELALRAAGYGPRPVVDTGGASPLADAGVAAGPLPAPAGPDPDSLSPSHRMFERHDVRGFALRAGYRASDAHAGPYALGTWPWRGRPADWRDSHRIAPMRARRRRAREASCRDANPCTGSLRTSANLCALCVEEGEPFFRPSLASRLEGLDELRPALLGPRPHDSTPLRTTTAS